jgi:hypothetical protein
MGNNLAVKVTADVADLNSNFLIAQARANALATELRALAKATGGIANPAAIAGMQQLSGDLIAARQKVAGMAEELGKAGVSAGGFGNRMRTETQGIGGAFESMSGMVNNALKFSGIGLAIEGIHKLSEAITEAGQRANDIRNMSEVIGVTGTQFQAMQIAAEETGIEANQLFRAMEKLVNVLHEARDKSGAAVEKLKELGITNDQINNKAFDAAQMMAYFSSRLNDASTAASEQEAMLKVLGPRVALASRAFKELGSDVGVWTQKVREANGTTDEQNKRLSEMAAYWAHIGRQIENATSKMLIWSADATKGAQLASMAAALTAPGLAGVAALTAPEPPKPAAQGSVSGKIDRSGGAAASADADARSAAAQRAQAAIAAANAAITKDTLDSIRDQIEGTKQGSAARLALVRQFYQDSLAYYANDPTVDKVKEAHRALVAEERQHGEELKREAEKNASDLVAATREKASEIMAEEGVSKAQQLAQVRDLYAEELQSATLTKEKRVEVERSLNEAIAAVHREASSTSQAIARSDADTNIAIARLSIAAEKQVLDQQLAAHQINAAQKLAISRQFAAEEFALNQKALANELGQLHQGTAEYERVYNQIRELKAKLVLDMVALDRQAAIDAKKAADEEATAWKGAVSEIEGAESTMIGDLLSGRKSFAASAMQAGEQLATKEIEDAARAVTTRLLLGNTEEAQKKAMEQGGVLYHLFAEGQKTGTTVAGTTARASTEATGQATTKTLDAAGAAVHTAAEGTKTGVTAAGVTARTGAEASSGIFSVIARTIASWFGAETAKTGATAAGAGIRTTTQAAADTEAMAVAKLTALSEINASAAVGAAAAGASVAAIPFYGWAMAAPTAAATYGELAAYAGTLAFDQGAWNLPHDMHGVTVHKGETIMPRPFAEDYRANVSGAGGQSGGQGGGDTYGPTHIENNFHGVHPTTDSIMAHFAKAVRNGHPALRNIR